VAARDVHGSGLRHSREYRKEFLMGLILLVVLCVLLLGGLPRWRYSRTWGYVPSGVMGLLLVILLVLLFAGYVPTSL
jgi:Protein of unknown function (DUF3309)